MLGDGGIDGAAEVGSKEESTFHEDDAGDLRYAVF